MPSPEGRSHKRGPRCATSMSPGNRSARTSWGDWPRLAWRWSAARRAENGFALQEIPVDPPIRKVFPAESTDDAPAAEGDSNSRTFVADGTDGSLAGFATVSYAPWNRRLAIEDIEIAPAHRGQGVGRALMGHAVKFARESGAGHI